MAGDRMLVRFGYVAMSVLIQNASPSRTMTATNFKKLLDREAALRKLERLAAENIHNCLRLLRHNAGHEIHLFRFSSKIIPLYGHEMLSDWDPFPVLARDFAELGGTQLDGDAASSPASSPCYQCNFACQWFHRIHTSIPPYIDDIVCIYNRTL